MPNQGRQADINPTAQPLPAYLSYSAYIGPNGEREYTVVQLPQTYYGPSIPLGTDGAWVYGGPSSPVGDAEAAPTDPASIIASAASEDFPTPPVTTAPPAPPPTTTAPPAITTDRAFLSTLSGASIRSTSLAQEISSAFSALSEAELASQSINSIFSQASSAVSVFSTGSTESTHSTASVRSVSRESVSSLRAESLTSVRESRSSTRSVRSTESVRSVESARSTASGASVTSLASVASVASVSSVSRTSQPAESTRSTASVAAASSLSQASQSSLSAQSTASTTSSTPTLAPVGAASKGLPTRDIIALTIGLFFALLLLLLLLLCLFRWRQRRNRPLVAQRRIPAERSHSVHQSMFFGRGGQGGPSDGRVMVQGTVFDLWTPEQRAARERAQQRRSVSSWAGRTLALITGSRGSRGTGSGGSGGSRGSRRTGSSLIGVARKVSRTAAEDGLMLEEETPLVGHQSPPLSPPPFHSPPPSTSGPTPLPPVAEAASPHLSPPLGVGATRDSHSTFLSGATRSANQSGTTLPLSLQSRPETPGEGEHETAELLVAQRATRSPSPKMGRLSWFKRMGIIGSPAGASSSSQEGHAGSLSAADPAEEAAAESETEQEQEQELKLPEMAEVKTEAGSSLKSWLEMGGIARSFPQPPPIAASGPASSGGQQLQGQAKENGTNRLSTISTNTVYHDALSELPTNSSRAATPPVPPIPAAAVPAPPAPSTPPRRRPVPPFLGHHRGLSSSNLLGSRTDLLDSPVPSPLRRGYNASASPSLPSSPPSAWTRQQAFSPELELDDELPPPPATAWRSSRGSDEVMSPLELSGAAFGSPREREDEPRRSGSMKRFTFGYPSLPTLPASTADEPTPTSPRRYKDKPHVPPRPLPPGAAPPSVRDSFGGGGQYDAVSIDNPSLELDMSYGASTSMTSTSTPRSSLHRGGGYGLGLEEPVSTPASSFRKSRSRGANPSRSDPAGIDLSGRQ